VRALVTRLRHRGEVTALLDGTARAFAEKHPELGVKWVWAPSDRANADVVAAKAYGYREVMVSELPPGVGTPHSLESGPVRVGDLILMAAPREVHEAIMEEDARVAAEEANLPVQEYLEYLKSIRPAGVPGRPTGGIKQSVEYVGVDFNAIRAAQEQGGE
jgi:hypothetical protein